MLRVSWCLLLPLCVACVADPVFPGDMAMPADLAMSDADAALDLVDADAIDAALSADLVLVDLTAGPPDLTPVIPAWIDSNDGLDGAKIVGIAVASNAIYVATLFDVYGSLNDGLTFSRVPIPDDYVRDGIGAIGAQGTHLFIGVGAGRVLEYNAPDLVEITDAAFLGDKPDGLRVIAQIEADRSAARERVFVSDGNNVFSYEPTESPPWTRLSTVANSFPSGKSIFYMASNPDGSLLYVTATDGVLTWNGTAWSFDNSAGAAREIDTIGLGSSQRTAITMYPTVGEHVPLSRSGTTWDPLPSVGDTQIQGLSLGIDGSLMLTARGGLWYLSAAPSAWVHSLDLPDSQFTCIRRDAARSKIYAGGKRGLYATTAANPNTGAFLDNGIHGMTIAQITQSPRDADVLYAATDNGLFRSNDGGLKWNELAALGPRRAVSQVIALDANGEDRLFVIAEGELFRSNDAGITFTDLGFAAHHVAAHGVHPDYVFVCAGSRTMPNGVQFSQNAGSDFAPLGNAPASCDAIVVTSDGALTLASDVAWWFSPNPTTTSVVMRGVYATANRRMLRLIEVPTGGSVLGLTAEVASTQRDLFVLPYTGSATQIAKPVLAPGLRDLAMSPAEPNRLWLATRDGVYVGNLGDGVYNAALKGLPYGEVTAIAHSRTQPTRGWVGVEERGMFLAE